MLISENIGQIHQKQNEIVKISILCLERAKIKLINMEAKYDICLWL